MSLSHFQPRVPQSRAVQMATMSWPLRAHPLLGMTQQCTVVFTLGSPHFWGNGHEASLLPQLRMEWVKQRQQFGVRSVGFPTGHVGPAMGLSSPRGLNKYILGGECTQARTCTFGRPPQPSPEPATTQTVPSGTRIALCKHQREGHTWCTWLPTWKASYFLILKGGFKILEQVGCVLKCDLWVATKWPFMYIYLIKKEHSPSSLTQMKYVTMSLHSDETGGFARPTAIGRADVPRILGLWAVFSEAQNYWSTILAWSEMSTQRRRWWKTECHIFIFLVAINQSTIKS